MSIALTYSVAGMQASADRLAVRANNIANVQTPGFRASEVIQQSTGSGPVVSERTPVDRISDGTSAQASGQAEVPVPSQQYSLPLGDLPLERPPEAPSDVSLEYELTDVMRAEHAYKASANVVRTVGQMQDTLLDIFT